MSRWISLLIFAVLNASDFALAAPACQALFSPHAPVEQFASSIRAAWAAGSPNTVSLIEAAYKAQGLEVQRDGHRLYIVPPPPGAKATAVQKIARRLKKYDVRLAIDPAELAGQSSTGVFSPGRKILFLDLETILHPDHPSRVFAHEYRHAIVFRLLNLRPDLEPLLMDGLRVDKGAIPGAPDGYEEYFQFSEIAEHTHDLMAELMATLRGPEFKKPDSAWVFHAILKMRTLGALIETAAQHTERLKASPQLNISLEHWNGERPIAVVSDGSAVELELVLRPEGILDPATGQVRSDIDRARLVDGPVREAALRKLKDQSAFLTEQAGLTRELTAIWTTAQREPTVENWRRIYRQLRRMEKLSDRAAYRSLATP